VYEKLRVSTQTYALTYAAPPAPALAQAAAAALVQAGVSARVDADRRGRDRGVSHSAESDVCAGRHPGAGHVVAVGPDTDAHVAMGEALRGLREQACWWWAAA